MGCGASNSAVPVVARNGQQPGSVNSAPVTLVSRRLVGTKPYRHGAQITLREITQQRADFWATRTDGNAQMWQAIRSSAEALLANDIGLANAIIEASSITTPNGSLEVCYDERGAQYKVPQYCTANPMELSSNDNTLSISAPSLTASATVIPAGENKSNKTTPKAASTNNAPVTVRVRINPGDHNLTVKTDSTHLISEMKAAISAQTAKSGLPIAAAAIEPDRQRLIFMGKELRDNMRVSEVGFEESKVAQVFLRPVAAVKK